MTEEEKESKNQAIAKILGFRQIPIPSNKPPFNEVITTWIPPDEFAELIPFRPILTTPDFVSMFKKYLEIKQNLI